MMPFWVNSVYWEFLEHEDTIHILGLKQEATHSEVNIPYQLLERADSRMVGRFAGVKAGLSAGVKAGVFAGLFEGVGL